MPIGSVREATLRRESFHDVRHARLNIQRKILEALWLIWRRRESYQPEKFLVVS